MPIIERTANSIVQLVDEVLSIAGSLSSGRFLWYRGLTCSTFKLLPSLLRDGKEIEQVYDREKRLMTRFRQRSMAYWPGGYLQDDWEHLFAMQHFGLPTRLLDWSENVFVALHFAALSSPTHGSCDPCIPTLWCMDPVEWNQSSPALSDYGAAIQVLTTVDDEVEAYRPTTNKKRTKSPLAIFGAHNSARIVAQRGTFVVWGNSAQPLEDFASQQAGRLWRITISLPRTELQYSLRSLGFTETMVFPDLPALGLELSRTEGWK
jgi:hypothetical protein